MKFYIKSSTNSKNRKLFDAQNTLKRYKIQKNAHPLYKYHFITKIITPIVFLSNKSLYLQNRRIRRATAGMQATHMTVQL